MLSLLKAIPALRSRFGKVYVSFGEPLPLDPLIRRHAPELDRASRRARTTGRRGSRRWCASWPPAS